MISEAQAFELLRKANPVPAEALGGLAVRAEAIRPDGDSLEPPESGRGRRQISPLRLALAVVGVAVASLLVAPALGLDLSPLDFWTAEKAPPRVVRDFETLDLGAPRGMETDVIPGATRRVASVSFGGRVHTLWAAPTRHGGFCALWEGAGGGCDKRGTVPLSVTWSARGIRRVDEGGRPDPTPGSFNRIYGHVNAAYADAVEIRFADGAVVRPQIIWVSEPIGAGFFVYEFTQEQRRPGHEVSAVVALDDDGEIVAEDPRPAA
jgi:hypothetical protein